MKKYLLLVFVAALFTVSCKKEEQPIEEPVPIEDLLTKNVWKAEQIRTLFDNGLYQYYKRGEVGNIANYDSDSLRFNIDKTGTYYYQGAEYAITWEFTNTNKDKLKLVISRQEGPEHISWENVYISPTQLKYVQYPTNTNTYLSSVTRVPN